jgi:hypothetical protein
MRTGGTFRGALRGHPRSSLSTGRTLTGSAGWSVSEVFFDGRGGVRRYPCKTRDSVVRDVSSPWVASCGRRARTSCAKRHDRRAGPRRSSSRSPRWGSAEPVPAAGPRSSARACYRSVARASGCRSGFRPCSARRRRVLNWAGVSGALRRRARASARVRPAGSPTLVHSGLASAGLASAGGTALEAVGRSRATIGPLSVPEVSPRVRTFQPRPATGLGFLTLYRLSTVEADARDAVRRLADHRPSRPEPAGGHACIFGFRSPGIRGERAPDVVMRGGRRDAAQEGREAGVSSLIPRSGIRG